MTKEPHVPIALAHRLLAVDPGLTCSGWALFEVGTNTVVSVGRIRSKPTTFTLGERLADFQAKVDLLLKQLRLGIEDALLCEAPTTMKDPSAAHKVEQIRGIFETLARSRGVDVPGRINPRSVHFEVLGLRGSQVGRETVKDTAAFIAHKLYEDQLRKIGFPATRQSLADCQDIADALLLGGLGVQRLMAAHRASIPAHRYFHDLSLRARKPRGQTFRRR